MRRATTATALILLVAAACSSGDDGTGVEPPDSTAASTTTDSEEPAEEPAEESADEVLVLGDHNPACDQIDERHCLLPFPSDVFTTNDPTTDTGMRIALPAFGMPVNADGVVADGSDWSASDGFSPGAMALVHLPGIDLERSGAPPITDIGRSLDADSPTVLVDLDTGERVPHWVEYDANASSADTSLLILRPARALAEGHRHAVVMRDLVDEAGTPTPSSRVFGAYRDGVPTDSTTVEARRDHMEMLFADLQAAGVGREGQVVAWDFTVASQDSLSGRLLAVRDDAFGALGDASPTFAIESVDDEGGARIVAGSLTVPGYLDGDGGPGSRMLLDGDGNPERGADRSARFLCTLPASGPAPVSLYGHGLLGSAEEVLGVGTVAAAAGRALCAMDWIGMSTNDVATVVEILGDISDFGTLPDRLIQAHLDFLFLGRALVHPQGLASDPSFQDAQGSSLIDGARLTFIGASQGGILGGATSAVAQDWDRVALVVGATNYSTLLRRSIDFDAFAEVVESAYPDELERTLGTALVQMLWDRGEANGYSQHLVDDPLPRAEAKTVLLFEAFGDHQVANVATDNYARTMGIPVHRPSVAPGRSPDVEPQWGLEAISTLPHTDSALIVWDYDAPPPPTTNTPPREGDDPHGAAGSDPAALALIIGFLDGSLGEICGGDACRTPAT